MFIITAWNALIARMVPGSMMPVTGTSVWGCGSRLFSSDWMTKTSPGPFTASCPTEVKMGGATLPTSSVLRMVGDGARHMATDSFESRVTFEQDGRRPSGRQPARSAGASINCAVA